MSENILRGSLTSTQTSKGALGFKGERGYSAYEIAVQHGFEGTEEDWLATLGTSSHFSKDVAVYDTTASTTEFNAPTSIATGDFVDVYINGFKLNENEYTFNTTKVILNNAVLSGNTVEILVSRMSTNNLPISTSISSSSTNDTASGTKSVYDYIETLFNRIYPVGSIYMSVNSTNPGTIFGGTWEQIQDRFLLACGNTYANGSTGGEATHQLTISEMPSHEHILNTMVNPGTPTAENHSVAGGQNTWSSVMAKTQPEGGSVAHNNMPPYLAVYVWKRTA